jgi:similar to stage IV sporulation protein
VLAQRIWNYIRGYVVIRVEGTNLERFLNLSIASGVYIWDIKRIDFTAFQAKVSLKGYRLLRSVRTKTGCRVSVQQKKGCPFLLHRIKRRKALTAGGILALAVMYLLTSFVWVVEVNGNKSIAVERIVNELEILGLKPGVFKYKLDPGDIETKFLIRMDQVAWIAVNIIGTKAIVEIVERVEPPQLVDKETPCNIVAKRDGIIDNIYIFQGQPKVKEGDTVKAGQLLISSVVEKPGMPTRMVHAMGRVEARTWYSTQELVSLATDIRERTGQSYRKLRLKIGDMNIGLIPGDIGFAEYDKTEQVKRLQLWRNIILPVELIIENYHEVNVVRQEISIDEAVQAIEQRLAEEVPEDARVVDRSVKYYEQDGGKIKVEVVLETIEDIGIEERTYPGRIEN